MANPSTPVVPNAPGVPPVKPGIPETTGPEIVVTARKADGPNVARKSKVSWAILNESGKKALTPDSFFELEETKEYNVPRYPLEGGGFQSFNKVETPLDLRVAVTKAGKDADKTTFLAGIALMANSLSLFKIVTPGRTYKNMSLVHYDQHRGNGAGVGLLTVHLAFVEARITATSKFSDTRTAQAADNASEGAVQSSAPSATQTPKKGPQ